MAIAPITGSSPVFIPVTAKETPVRGDTQSRQPAVEKPGESKNDNPSQRRQDLSKEEQHEVTQLVARDREVKTHEAAHKAAGGALTGPASFSYTTGPDGKRYATGGEVSIETSSVRGDPQATLMKANRIRAAALAPAEPSGQDRKVASQASRMAADARAQIAQQKQQGDDARDDRKVNTSDQFNRQPLYDRSASVSNTNGTGNVLDYMV